MARQFIRSKKSSFTILIASICLLASPAHAVVNVFFVCTPFKFTKIVALSDWLEDIPCAEITKTQPGANLCDKFRMDAGDLTTNGGFYNVETATSDADGKPVEISFRLSRANGNFLLKVTSDYGESKRSGICELRQENLKY